MREVFICSLNDTNINSNYKVSSYEEKASKTTWMTIILCG